MTIYIIARGIPGRRDPQWGCFEFDQAKALAGLGHKVVYLSVDRRFRLYWRKLGFARKEKDGVVAYNSFLLPNVLVRKLFGRRILTKFRLWQLSKLYLKACHENGKPAVIYSHYLFVTQEAAALSKKVNVPLVAIEHWSEINKDTLLDTVRQMGEQAYPQASAVISVSGSLQHRLRQHFNVDSMVVHNMVGNEFSYLPAIQESDKINYISTGSLLRPKSFDLLPKAFALADLPKDKWQMLLVGEGEERGTLQQQIDAAGYHDNILLVGKKCKEDIARLLNQSNVFVLPSRSENFSVAVLEALACGLPVVASICGGIRECIDDKNGLLFEVDDVNGLAEALKYMFYHHQKYDHKAIADDCQARFSPEVIARQLTNIFEDVVANHAQKSVKTKK